ncbi:hypothetical protein GCM10022198_24790 [Klugiella xanthotipulae]|uniref:Leucine-rich repeat (LRR) protein n=1 Tax=Klugiella xanthotipulae TaxID=244735 RepID=A0A543HZ89_9MICO|nr:leucine-rich repeat domain-containing protein [Klugiella xanthotipulae]TQM63628.1 Leucine-rich repeat (LRR) protein [Klugiella xanthotipulae]
MKKLLTLLTVSALAAGSVLLAQPASAVIVTPVAFADAKLASCVTSSLGLAPDAIVTVAEAATITSLNCDSQGIVSLGGIESLTGIVNLSLASNAIVDVTPLAGLTTLSTLQLQENKISDVAPLSALPRLKWLYLWTNQIADLSSLTNSLERLWIEGQVVTLPAIQPGVVQANPVKNFRGQMVTPVSSTAVVNATTNTWTFSAFGDQTLQWRAPLDATPVSGYFSGTLKQTVEGTPVVFASDYLRSCVNRAIGRGGDQQAPVSAVQAASVTSLDCTNAGINNLGGAESLVNLTSFSLGQNTISDLTPLAGLTKLTQLQLQQNKVSNLTPLAGLTELNWLYLWTNQVTDLSALKNLSLERLWIEGQTAALPTLAVGEAQANPLKDADGVAVQPASSTATIDAAANTWSFDEVAPNNTLTWRAPVRALETVGDYFSGTINQASEGSGVVIEDQALRTCINSVLKQDANAVITKTQARSVTLLDCSGAGVTTLSGLQDFTKLTSLNLANNQVSDLSPLKNLTALTELSLAHTAITSLSDLAGLSHLKTLEIQQNQVSDLSPLAGLSKLSWLYAWTNNIADVSPLKSLTLDRLWIEGQTVTLGDLAVGAVQNNPLFNLDGKFVVSTSSTATVDAATGGWTFAAAGNNTLTWRVALNPGSAFLSYFSGTVVQTSVDAAPEPTEEPTVEPTVEPEPTEEPTVEPTVEPEPTEEPTDPVVPTESTDSTDSATSDESAK